MYCSVKKVYAKTELFTALLMDLEGFCDMTPGQWANSDRLTICQLTQCSRPIRL